MRNGHFRTLILGLLFLSPALTRADQIATIDVTASFIPSALYFGNGPTLFMTGQFVLDEDTQTIGSWNLGFLGPSGATYQLSAQNGGVASAFCPLPCPVTAIPPFTTPEGWDFSFGNSVASTQMQTVLGTDVYFYPGEIVPLCANQNTYYPGNPVPAISFGCFRTSSASFDGETGWVYQSSDSSMSSGNLFVISVVSTPEPSELNTLLLGIAVLCGYIMFQRRNRGARTV